MKKGKGGNRKRIISWFFNEERHKKEQAKEDTIETSTKVTTTLKDNTIYETIQEVPFETSKEKQSDINPVITVEHIETLENSKKQKQEVKPTIIVDHINDIETSKKAKKNGPVTSKPNDKELISLPPKEKTELKIEEVASNIPTLSEDKTQEQEKNSKTDNLLQASIVQELNRLLQEDVKDLNDIYYKLKVIESYDKDTVLVEEVERLQKELQELIKRFEDIKKKYNIDYHDISLKDLDLINDLDIESMIENYILEGKNGNFDERIFGPIIEIKTFINIINGIINIEKDKDIIEENLEEKLDTYKIRDDEFEKLQDSFANIEKINDETEKYRYKVNSIIDEINLKLKSNVNIEKSIETTMAIVPDINRILKATVLMASSNLIPPTPAGRLFKTSLLIAATHMLATSFRKETKEKEITHITLTDYSKFIQNNINNINSVLSDITSALDEINYMKDAFEKNFSSFRNQIPEYDKFIENIFSIEKELSKNQLVIRGYSDEVERSLEINNQKIKTYEEC